MSTQDFERELRAIVGAERVLADEPLAAHTTFRIGGPAQWLVLPRSESEVAAVVNACEGAGVPWRVLGLGSNVLAPDEGLPGVTVKLAENFSAVEVLPGGLVRAQAGATNEAVAEAALAAGLAGYEFASGIPGTVGGAAIMNAGAYDGQFSDVAVEVRCLAPANRPGASGGDNPDGVGDKSGPGEAADGNGDPGEAAADAIVTLSAAQAEWGYRASRMMREGLVVLSATLQLAPDSPAAIRARMDDLHERRASKQPLEMPSAGSTFKRPEGHFAGALIQEAGCQGTSVGGAQVSTKHAGFVVNTGDATAADVLALIAEVQRRVHEASGVTLEPEVRLWG
ncbi:UDP-N-acetylmuramate dehydrogenase [Adlercreutzia caecimuris]|uniref:UDP-N-acetylmuramate dehydrogenase n=1 Tax=Adlercreutzia caecimuris TaxID=671266 RepID=UPI001372AD1B|nr:UDP-N-acetylmuramate dehydrogenase [Adlercreutzia caecimuris]NBJ67626.1 UDP-N-acetylmuramate dehydrogenase [Adlercreutzia caecimuris]